LGSWGYPPYVDFWDLSAKISPLVFACLILRLLDSHPHIYLGLMGLSLRCRLLGLVGQKFPPLSSPALISRLLDSHPHIYLGLMGLCPRYRLLGLVGKNFPPCLRLPYFKAFGLSHSYLPWAHGAVPQF